MFWTIVFIVIAVLIAIPIVVYLWSLYHIPKKQVAVFCREMSIMIDAGIPLLKIFKILSERVSHERLRKIVQEIQTSVEHGNTVAAAMANHTSVFDEMMIGIIKVGETGGVLDESLRRLSNHLEKVIRLRRKVIVASIYPCLAVVVMLAVLLVLLTYVFPILLEPIKNNPRVEMPWPTHVVDVTGQFIINNWFTLVMGIVAFFVLIGILRKTMPGKIVEDYLRIRFPVLGNLLGVRVIAARVSATFATLIHCGIPMISCLKIIAQTQPNYFVSQSFRRTAQFVEEGGNLVKPLEESGIYPPLMLDMLAIGDESGTLDTVLDKISQTFSEEVDAALEVFTQVQESLMILTLGLVVLFVALAAYMPYFQIGQVIG